jgi:hypothetical protein
MSRLDQDSLRQIIVPVLRSAMSLVTLPRLVTIFLIALFLRPDLYQWVIETAAPKYYYEIAILKQPPDFTNVSPVVDVHGIDSSPRRYLLRNVLDLGGQVARIKEDGYIPGRSDTSGASREGFGKTWTGKQCLFISHVHLTVLDLQNDVFDPEAKPQQRIMSVPMKYVLHDHRDEPILDISSESLTGTADQKALDYLTRLLALFGRHKIAMGQCSRNLGERHPPYCPRIAVWAYGATAPCTIWPF